MWEFLKRLFQSDFMPHGNCWRWEPWVVGTHAVSDALIALCYTIIAFLLIHLVRRRRDVPFNGVVVMFGLFTFACGCTHALEVYNTWHGVFRLAGLVKVVTAGASLLTTWFLLRSAPVLLRVPTLDRVLTMDAALVSERQEKRKVEGQLQETKDRFRLLVEGVKDYALVLLDPQGRVTSWNPGAELITGYSEAEILGQPFAGLFTPQDLAADLPGAMLRQAAACGRVVTDGARVRKDGTRFFVNEVITAFHDAEGALQGFAKVTRDITEQRATQAALQNLAETLEEKVKIQVQELHESEARLQGFIRHAPAAIAFKGLNQRYLLINPRMEALIGRPAREILGKTNEELFPEEQCAWFREGDDRVLAQGQAIEQEMPWIHEDGSTRCYLSQKFPLVDATGQFWGLGIISTDITERRQADQALLQSQKLESLGVLTGGIAHDFNNLLGAMLGNVELAMLEPTMAGARPFHETLKGLMSRAADLLRQMLAYAGMGKVRTATFDLNRIVEEMTQLLGSSISKKAAIRLELHPAPLPMCADLIQIQQVVMNLVINASEALEGRNGVIAIRTGWEQLKESATPGFPDGQPLEPGRFVRLEVADNGIGMAPEVMKRIFDPFFTTKFAGRGLGLAAIHGIVRAHHGGIQVSSAPGQGSRFTLLFPAAPGPPAVTAPAPLQAPVATGGGPGAGKGILVVEDETELREVAVKALDAAGFRTLQARDGREALEACQGHRDRIDLVLMDLTMPKLDGEEACRELRRRGAGMPVILCSGFNEADSIRRFEGLGLAAFIQKPYALADLVALVNRVLSG